MRLPMGCPADYRDPNLEPARSARPVFGGGRRRGGGGARRRQRSHDGSAEYAEGKGRRYCGCQSTGIRRRDQRGRPPVTTPWVAILNNDVEVEPGYFAALQRAARSPARVGNRQDSEAQRRELLDATIDAISRAGCPWRAGHGRPDRGRGLAGAGIGPARSLDRSAVPHARCSPGRPARRALRILPGRRRFRLRAALAGVTGCYVDTARAYHHGSATLGRWHGETVRRMSRNQLWLVAKHFPAAGSALRLGSARRPGLWIAVAFRHGAGWAAVRGKWEALRTYREIRREGPQADSTERLATLLEESEQEIEAAQRATGWDAYWKWYFRLT